MNARILLSTATGLSLMAITPAPASTKPCRDKDGRIVQCPKTRKSSPRCKDAQGRFTACPTSTTDVRQPATNASSKPAAGATNGSSRK